MRYLLVISLFILSFSNSNAQDGWTWTELANMPEGVANNAVCSAYCGDTLCVYSFSGIDQTLIPAGIHLKSWRYNTVTQEWISLPDVPDFQGKIAAGASTVNNLIYVVGGYYVNDNFTEESSDDIHIFDPETNSWLNDGALIPVPIDDQVQAVWNDSLIFVVTGWSDFQNVNAVQIYDPANDEWLEGTPTPNFGTYRVFGGAGSITGDSLFYYGGVSNSFNSTNELRRGVINPDDPSEVTWSVVGDGPGDDGYRCAPVFFGPRLYWIGGAGNGYNFDADAYDGSGIVDPLNRIIAYHSHLGIWEEGLGAPFGQMDFRGAAQVSPTSWIICGGMEADQVVSSRTFLLELDPSVGVNEETSCVSFIANSLVSACEEPQSYWVYDLSGRLCWTGAVSQGSSVDLAQNLPSGIYVVRYGATSTRLVIK